MITDPIRELGFRIEEAFVGLVCMSALARFPSWSQARLRETPSAPCRMMSRPLAAGRGMSVVQRLLLAARIVELSLRPRGVFDLYPVTARVSSTAPVRLFPRTHTVGLLCVQGLYHDGTPIGDFRLFSAASASRNRYHHRPQRRHGRARSRH